MVVRFSEICVTLAGLVRVVRGVVIVILVRVLVVVRGCVGV